ncbi:MAG TPA: DUF4440 domain-containing protein [Terracidiphilus sp.]|nr:DUF4440 domain-containing protein [Terracidiphilus sp.]
MSVRSEVSRTVAAELLHCELQLLSPRVRRDRNRVSALLARDFVEFGASGRMWSREETLEELARETEFETPVMEDFRCRQLAEDLVLVTYRTVRGDMEAGVRQMSLRSSLWSKQMKGWVLRFHQGTRATGVAAATPRGA